MNRITIIGKYCNGFEAADGQSIKTRIVTENLKSFMGEENIHTIDTFGWKKHPLGLFSSCVKAVWDSDHVIFMTDAGGIKIFPWLLTVSNILRTCRIHYVVIGAWLDSSLQNRPLRRYWLKKLDGIYVETSTMKSALEARGLKNIVLLPNCKPLSVLTEEELPQFAAEPYPLCTFSRVMKEKGIEDAVRAVEEINRKFGRQVYTLDIYGQVDAQQLDWFETLKNSFSQSVRYCGIVAYDQSVEVLKKYFALLFPTLFYTEGIPGTIIDAFAAGLPAISSQWESFGDIMDEKTCLSYAFGSYDGLVACMEKAALDPSVINDRRMHCLQQAQAFTPERVMKILHERLK